MDQETSIGIMDKVLKDCGKWEQKMDMEYGNPKMEISIKVNGVRICNMERAHSHIN